MRSARGDERIRRSFWQGHGCFSPGRKWLGHRSSGATIVTEYSSAIGMNSGAQHTIHISLIEETMMPEPLLRIMNNHTASCGDPPILAGDDPNQYTGYFENGFGEQWIFAYDRPSQTARLRGGDIGRNESIPVHDGKPADVILSASEQAWLGACWQAAVHGR